MKPFWPLWAALFLAPILGWLSALILLAVAVSRIAELGIRRAVAQTFARRQTTQWLTSVALGWWFVLLIGDLLARNPVAWWSDLRFLLVLLPALVLCPAWHRSDIRYEAIGRWATWSVWITVIVIALEYWVAVKWMGLPYYRPRALSGNALFVSAMLMPLMLWCWLAPPASEKYPWMRPLATYLAGLMCLASLLGARTSTLIAVLLLPFALWWGGRHGHGWQRLKPVVLGLFILTLALAAWHPWMSDWYEQRWTALVQVIGGNDPTALQDYGIATRAQHWPAAWRAFLDRPWSGHGFLNEVAILRAYLPPGTPVLPTAHQQFLSFLLWSGVPGLVAGVLFIGLPLVMVLIRRRGSTAWYAACALAVPMLLNGLTDTVFDDLRIVSYHLTMVILLDAAVETQRPDLRGEAPVEARAAT